ncbi:hypothetical protein ACO1PK_01435 [Alishewanella sp. d11]|uniref:hypothetical protein n=1 Tax=Alishewanella sp. d11 TaxID=3414030 RepID=UPI003BF7BD2E
MKTILWFVLAVLAAAILGSVLQSIFNLFAIANLVGAVPVSLWLSTIGFDLVNFMPILAVIFLPIMLLSLLATRFLRRLIKLSLLPASFGVTVLATWLALLLINHFVPMPTLIALNRSTIGTLLLISCSGTAVMLFYFMAYQRRTL